jgi:hypothetical protein
MNKIKIFKLAAMLLFIFPLIASVAFAGTISDTDKYAWSDNLGWINFSPKNGNVDVTDTKVTGYVWSANSGWINLAPTKGGVMNDGKGNLSGSAWGENTGWIDFAGVTIDSNGLFAGTATGLLSGTITFSCPNCKVTTTWRSGSEQTPNPTASPSINPANTSHSSSGSRVAWWYQQPAVSIPNVFTYVSDLFNPKSSKGDSGVDGVSNSAGNDLDYSIVNGTSSNSTSSNIKSSNASSTFDTTNIETAQKSAVNYIILAAFLIIVVLLFLAWRFLAKFF